MPSSGLQYDVFLSHSHADKDWVRALYDDLAGRDYNGRPSRVWLDQDVLDPGELSSERELQSALEQTQWLVIVLSPESVASIWVQREIAHFLKVADLSRVVVLRHRACKTPAALKDAMAIDWPANASDADADLALTALLDSIFVAEDGTLDDHRQTIRRAWKACLHSQPVGLDSSATPENTALVQALFVPDLREPRQEGVAIAGFDRVGAWLVEIDGAKYYGAKMVAGELLALAVLRDPAYQMIGARWLEIEDSAHARPSLQQIRMRAHQPRTYVGPRTNLSFAAARANSKLAELNPDRVDLATLWAILDRLDENDTLADHERSLVAMIGRALGKLRGTPIGYVVIHSLARFGGAASQDAAAGAICTGYKGLGEPYWYLPELRTYEQSGDAALPNPPSWSTAQLLLEHRMHHLDWPTQERHRSDLLRVFGESFPPRPAPGYGPVAGQLWRGPMAGRVRRVDVANMETVAETIQPTDLVCIAGPRVVDALFAGAGGFIIEDQPEHTPLCQRLKGRGSRVAMLAPNQMERLSEGDVVTFPVPMKKDDPRSMGLRHKTVKM